MRTECLTFVLSLPPRSHYGTRDDTNSDGPDAHTTAGHERQLSFICHKNSCGVVLVAADYDTGTFEGSLYGKERVFLVDAVGDVQL